MIKGTISLIKTNKNKLFVAIVVLVLSGIGFVIKYSFFPENSANTVDKRIINIGITLEQYEQGLKNREKEVTTRLTTAHEAEKSILQIELSAIQAQSNDVNASYSKYIANLEQKIVDLEKIKADYPNVANLLEGVLKQGDTQEADRLYAKIEQEGAKTVKVVAEAAFQRGNIAREDIRYADALQHYQKAHNLEAENTLYLNRLGLIYQILGEYKKAIEYYELALASDLKTYGEEHPKVATYRNNLGMAWYSLGKYEKAIEYYELALVSDLKTYGEAHPEVAIDRNNLGSAWKLLGKYEKAIEYFELALASALKTYGEAHPDVAIDRNNLGSAWYSLGKYEKAIEYLELALATFQQTLGDGHPSTKQVAENLAKAKKANDK